MRKITEAQRKALEALPVEITTWGGKPFAGMPEGIRSRSTLWALRERGLADMNNRGSVEVWRITREGKVAIFKLFDGDRS